MTSETPVLTPPAFGKHFERYCVLRRAAGIKEKTLEIERTQQRFFWRFLEEREYHVDELSVTSAMFHEYALSVNGRSDCTEHLKYNRLWRVKLFYQEAVRQDWILSDPTAGVRLAKREHNPIKVLSIPQMKKLLRLPDLSTVKGIRDRAIMELMYSSGLRRSELLSLKAEDFGEDWRTVRVRGKGDKDAVLPVGKMAAHFTRFYAEHIRRRLDQGKSPRLFLGMMSGQGMFRTSLNKMIREYGEKLGLGHSISSHIFRYSIATHLAEGGVDIRLIQEFLRHDWITTTARYIKQSFHQLREVHRSTHPRNR